MDRSIYIFFAPVIAQVDTMIWDYSKLQMKNQNYPDGYHVFKKEGVKVMEYLKVNGRINGVLKMYYDNGNPKLIAEHGMYYNTAYYSGVFKEFFESGTLKTEGGYTIVDSVSCVNCYDVFHGKQITKANSHSQRVGQWKEYYANGQLKATGGYNGIHKTYYLHYTKTSGEIVWIPGEYSEDHVKDKDWKYFNEKGELVKEEFYFQGALCDVKEYDR